MFGDTAHAQAQKAVREGGKRMPEQLADWPRKFYQGPGGKPFLFYVVYGAFHRLPGLDGQVYCSNGVFPGLELSHYDRS
jgi:hypothetical protein